MVHITHNGMWIVDRLYVSRDKGGQGLQSIEEVVKREENAMNDYVLYAKH